MEDVNADGQNKEAEGRMKKEIVARIAELQKVRELMDRQAK